MQQPLQDSTVDTSTPLPAPTPPPIIEGLLTRVVGVFDVFFSAIQSIIGIKGMAYVFVVPNLLIFGIFILFPMVLNFGYAFTGGSQLYLQDRPYVGTRNLEQLFECQDLLNYRTCREANFIRAISNTALFVISQVGLMIITALLTAVVLNRKIRGRAFFRSVFFYPVLLSPIVVALLWSWILRENGILNAFLANFGIDKIRFLSDVNWSRFWLVMISVWSQMGFYALILLAGLQAIPHDLYEAADMDGANEWNKFRRITIPLLMPTMLVVLVLALIRAVQVFDVVYAFTDGGPGTSTLFIVQYIYENGFVRNRRPGIAAAASLVMASALILFTLVQIRLRSRQGEL
jgi:alpha-1,4-digalacturonate transport system permease protein